MINILDGKNYKFYAWFRQTRYSHLIQRLPGILSSPRWLFLLMIFFVLYGQFFLQYGWKFRNINNADLPTFYSASVSVFELGESPYNPQLLNNLMDNKMPVGPYLYPPPSLLYFYPLSMMTYNDAKTVFLFTNHLFYLLMIWVITLFLVRARPGSNLSVTVLCIVYLLTFYPVIVTLHHGQVNIILLTFLVLFWLLGRKGHRVSAALFLSLAIVLKSYPIIFIPLLFLTGRWKTATYTVGWFGLWIAIALLALPAEVWRDWFNGVLPTGGYTLAPDGLFSPAAIWNQSLNGFFSRTFTDSAWSNPIVANQNLARLLAYAAAVLIAAFTAFAVWRNRRRSDNLDRTMFVGLPGMYLIAPFAWEHHLVYLLPSILLLLTSRTLFKFPQKIIYYILCLVPAILLGLPGLLGYKFFGAAILWGLCLFAVFSKNIRLLPDTSVERPATGVVRPASFVRRPASSGSAGMIKRNSRQ